MLPTSSKPPHLYRSHPAQVLAQPSVDDIDDFNARLEPHKRAYQVKMEQAGFANAYLPGLSPLLFYKEPF
jgi:hypothetical protein